MKRRIGLVAACLALGGSMGCSTLRTPVHLPTGQAGPWSGVHVIVFESSGADESGSVGPPHVVGVLERHEVGEGWRPIFRTLSPSWAVVGLRPDRYRVRIPAVLNAQGRELRVHGLCRVFDVEAWTISRVEVILDDRSVTREEFGALGYHPATDTVLIVTEDDEEAPAAEAAAAPLLLTHFPEDGASVVGADRIRIVVAFSTPLARGSIRPAALVVRTAGGEPIPGRVAYDGDRWWLTWYPEEDLPAGKEFLVTVSLPSAVDRTTTPLFAFRTVPPQSLSGASEDLYQDRATSMWWGSPAIAPSRFRQP